MLSSIARPSLLKKAVRSALIINQQLYQQQAQRTVVSIKKALVKAGETDEPEDVPALDKRM